MESLQKRRARAKIIFETLDPLYTREKTALKHRTPFQLLVATILSAQCTDVRVNLVTKTLFKKYKGPEDYLKTPVSELENDIRSTGFFRNKAKSIKGSAQAVMDLHEGKGQIHEIGFTLVILPTLTFDVFNCSIQLLQPPIETITDTMQVSAKTSRLESCISSLLDLVIVYPTEP